MEAGLSSDEDFPRSSVLRIVKTKTTTSGMLTYSTEMSAGALSLRVKAGLNDASAFPAPTLMIKWIPALIIDYALPDLLSRSKIAAKLKVMKPKPQGRPKKRAPHTAAPVAGPSRIAGMYLQPFTSHIAQTIQLRTRILLISPHRSLKVSTVFVLPYIHLLMLFR